ncbi:EAL domain-containing protein [bacterium]|nr:EAL domain-containing protein [bacterium]MCI0614080.1 EAL domain-containing protein [bacterium]
MPELTVHYQPIIDLNNGAVVGFEALSRLIDPDGTVRSAGEMIEQMEKNVEALYSLISETLKCVQNDFVSLFNKYPDFYVSVNVSPIILGGGWILALLEERKLRPYLNRLVCELTERQVLTDVGRTALEAARQQGIRVAVDDFGTGHSGLAQIVGLNLDILKIDQSLILSIPTNRMAAKLIRGLVALAGIMRMRTVVEGVETREQAFFLQAAGIDAGQGYLWSKAIPAEDLETVIQTGFSVDFGMN